MNDNEYKLKVGILSYLKNPCCIFLNSAEQKFCACTNCQISIFLPHIFKDVFFWTTLSAKPLFLNTVVQTAESDSGPLFLVILLHICTNHLLHEHFWKQKISCQVERGDRNMKSMPVGGSVSCTGLTVTERGRWDRGCNYPLPASRWSLDQLSPRTSYVIGRIHDKGW